jgi:hypothetical protein
MVDMKRKVRGSRWRGTRKKERKIKKKKIYGCGKKNFSAVSLINHCPNGESTFGDEKNSKRSFESVFILNV